MKLDACLSLLGSAADAETVQNALQRDGAAVERTEFPGGYFHLSSRANGINLGFDPTGTVQAIHLYLDGRDGFAACVLDAVPVGTSRDRIRAQFGQPSRSGGGKRGMLGRIVPDFDRFDSSSHFIHVEYDSRGTAVFVTLMRPDVT
jgi:hypothetical protein